MDTESSAGLFATVFGAAGDKAVPGDYTGDGRIGYCCLEAFERQLADLKERKISSFLAFPWGAEATFLHREITTVMGNSTLLFSDLLAQRGS